ncbi:MAG: GTPase [Maribacter sp.]|nr:GTPase [Maribacter sp.]MBT8313528.1 GTPase [Maribacter sp.]
MQEKLIFVYNADSGLSNMIIDGAHKIFSPSTYACNLCDITYGTFTENRIWKKFREATSLKMEFLHKDEFKNRYASKFGYKFDYPIVLITAKENLEVFINVEELNQLENAEDLIAMIQKRI